MPVVRSRPYPSLWSGALTICNCLASTALDAFARILHVFTESMSGATAIDEAHQCGAEQKRIDQFLHITP